jgi:enamine deaminase RidA (YjgF/YER057c/UK114 family)
LQPADIVQLKVFLEPMSEVTAVRKEITEFFGGQSPPTVFVEWISGNPPVEIELIATAKGDSSKEADSVSFLTPPGTTGSKVYSRIARVNHGRLIYVSGLYGMNSSDGGGQVRELFGSLGGILKKTGSDFEHLAKATYYVTDSEASNKLNELRPEFYNPQRPPAASKAKVKSVGVPGRTVTMDMIAVTK